MEPEPRTHEPLRCESNGARGREHSLEHEKNVVVVVVVVVRTRWWVLVGDGADAARGFLSERLELLGEVVRRDETVAIRLELSNRGLEVLHLVLELLQLRRLSSSHRSLLGREKILSYVWSNPRPRDFHPGKRRASPLRQKRRSQDANAALPTLLPSAPSSSSSRDLTDRNRCQAASVRAPTLADALSF